VTARSRRSPAPQMVVVGVNSFHAEMTRDYELEMAALRRQANSHMNEGKRVGHVLRAQWEGGESEFTPSEHDDWDVVLLARAYLESVVFDVWLSEDEGRVKSLLQM